MKQCIIIKGEKVEFDIDNLEDVNRIRTLKYGPGYELKSLNGYCWSSGCSCRHPNGSKGIPDCSRFKCYDEDGIKKDAIFEIFGI